MTIVELSMVQKNRIVIPYLNNLQPNTGTNVLVVYIKQKKITKEELLLVQKKLNVLYVQPNMAKQTDTIMKK